MAITYNSPYYGPTISGGYNVPSAQPSYANFVWVQGEAAAKAYPVVAGGTALLMDSENPVLYAKTVDASGKPLPLEVYDLVKRENSEPVEEPAVDLSSYATKDEVSEIVAREIEKAMSEISFKPNTKRQNNNRRSDD